MPPNCINKINNKEINNKELKESNTYESNQSISEPTPMDVMGYEEARECVMENIEYEIMCDRYPRERLDEIVDIA